MNIRNPWRGSHDMVLNTGRRVVIGVRVVHGHAEMRGEIAFYVKYESDSSLVQVIVYMLLFFS